MRKIVLAEIVSTFLLVLIGTGAIILNEEFKDSIGHLGISLAFGVIVFLMIFIFGKISGAHMNPGVSITLLLKKQIQRKSFVYYLGGQIIGGILASLLLSLVFKDNQNLGSTLPKTGLFLAWILEFMMSFILMFLILFLMKNKTGICLSAFSIGFLIFLEAYFGGPYTGASMNPIRSFSPALFSTNLDTFWIYLTAPISGMLAASLLLRVG